MSNVLVIAPHGDDEIIGCGGTILSHLACGDKVSVVYVTYGDALRSEYTQVVFTAMRRREIIVAANTLGLKEKNLLFMPEIFRGIVQINPPDIDAGGGYYPLRLNEMRLVNDLILLIRKVKPEVIYLPHEGESHLDHRVVAQIGQQAIRFAPGPWFRETGSGHEKFQIRDVWGYEVDRPIAKPYAIWDVTDARWQQKLEALRCHATTQDVPYFEKRMMKRHAELKRLKDLMGEFAFTDASEAFQRVNIWG